MSVYLNVHDVTKIKAEARKLPGCSILEITFTDQNGREFELTAFTDRKAWRALTCVAGGINGVKFGFGALDEEEAA
jgi:hypothetical protein